MIREEELDTKNTFTTLFFSIFLLICASTHVLHVGAETISHNSRYFRNNPENSTVIIFVHGVSGDPTSTWTNVNRAYWPDLLKNDPDFDKANIYMINYSSPVMAKAYSINELAECMWRDLQSDKVLNHSKLIFIAHSMGGLVTREFLLKYKDYADKVSLGGFLYFFATPTSGSSIARVMNYLSQNPQYGKMVPLKSDDSLADIQRNWLASEQMTRIPSYGSYEAKDTFGVMLVEQESATHLCNRPVGPIDKNHIDIVKPADIHDESYRAFQAAYLNESRVSKNNTLDTSVPIEQSPLNKNSGEIIPDVSKAKETIFNSLSQFQNNDRLVAVSDTVPGYFQLQSSPVQARYSDACVYTKESFSADIFVQVRIAGSREVWVLDLYGRGVALGLSNNTDKYYIYEAEENWTVWPKLEVKKNPLINTLAIHQRGRFVYAFINNKYVESYTKLKKAEPGPIKICFKANPKTGGVIEFQKLSVWDFQK